MADKSPAPFYCSNPFYTIKFFVLCHGFLQFSQLMTSGYMKSSISTIERRFGLSSQTSGMVASFHEVGNTMLIIFVSYFGSRVHRPRLIGCGAILVSVAGLVISVPHFVSPPYEYDQSISGSSSNTTDICLPNRKGPVTDVCTGSQRESNMILILLLFGQTLLGIGGVPIQPFGISYIDDFASPTNSPLYIGFIFAATALGPAVAFILGSFMLRFYVDIDKVSSAEVHITNKDPRWVGAWWLGFIFAASTVALASIPYFFFPREMPKEDEAARKNIGDMTKEEVAEKLKDKTPEEEGFTLFQFIKMFPVVLLRNLKNPIFVMVVFAMVNLSAMIAGLSTFLAKFLEQQFTLSASVANMILGAVNIPGAMLGIILGGALMKSCHFSLQQATLMCIISMAFCALFDVPLLFMGCPTQRIAGLDYSGSSGPWQLITPCNLKCNCSLSFFNPVCGQDRMEYLSPCFAGCIKININPITRAVMNYTECNCIIVNGAIGYAAPGHCSSSCAHFLMPFVLIAAISGFLGSLSHTPAFVLVLRSVKRQDKSFALGLQFLLLRVLAWLPAPVIYGSAIDTTCLLWQYKCKKRAGCRYYNHTAFRKSFVGIQLLFEICCFLSFCIVYVLLVRKEDEEEGEEEKRGASPKPTS
ncbi:solute carrier organic anion transporter family member 2B1 [Pantherophis guttatus]|uniref:Solute carrier organic anion transporter family member n=1 Tax=Pantherophis guttatus TaxID=94885 RepID=A0A6P9D7U3_PANGU|nr:solute carrier organic anion transporter family member 2B1 [Pantherophis guttatus]